MIPCEYGYIFVCIYILYILYIYIYIIEVEKNVELILNSGCEAEEDKRESNASKDKVSKIK